MQVDEPALRVVVGIVISLGAGDALRRIVRWVVNRLRWNRFDTDLQSWVKGEDTAFLPPDFNDFSESKEDELRGCVAALLKDARFDPYEAGELLDYSVAFAKGRLQKDDRRYQHSAESDEASRG